MRDLLKTMAFEFVIIVAGITASVLIFCAILEPTARFGIEILLQILSLSFFVTLPHLVFYSPKELSKKQMRIRQAIHIALVTALMFFFGYEWNWINRGSVWHPILFFLLFISDFFLFLMFFFIKCFYFMVRTCIYGEQQI